MHQLDHLTAELPRVASSCLGHRGLIEHKCSGIHETRATSLHMLLFRRKAWGSPAGNSNDLGGLDPAVTLLDLETAPTRTGLIATGPGNHGCEFGILCGNYWHDLREHDADEWHLD